MDVDELHSNRDAYHVIDSREGFEYRHAHIGGAISMSAFEVFDEANEAPSDKPLAIVCGDQVRSTLVASVLIRHGRDARLVWGGMVDWLDRKYPVEAGA
jgi:rhodanese-related sulfurtransferase